MARSYNKVTLIGNLGQDPEVRTTPNGTQVCTLSIATTERYKDRNGEWQESTDWHNLVLWDRLAEIAGQYLKKGSRIFAEGRIKYRSYEGNDGVKRYVTDIVAQNIIMLDSREGGSGHTSSNNYSQPSPEDHLPADSGADDDIPF